MTVSGTVSTTVFQTRKVIDHAFRRCRMVPEQITSEMIDTAKDNLYLMLSSLANQGFPLWCIEKEILPLYLGQQDIPTPNGTVDILNSNYRWLFRQNGVAQYSSAGGIVNYAFDGNLSTSCAQTTANGNIYVDYGSSSSDGTIVTTVGVMMATSGSFNIKFEGSNDLLTWTEVIAPGATTYVANRWQWYDAEVASTWKYFRMRETGGGTLNVVEFYIGNNPTEIPLARLNRDDYTNLPNKYFAGRPLQYWFDRQRDIPIMHIWPVTDQTSMFGQFIIWRQRYIMDVGTLTETLDVPQRWYEAIVWQLSWRLCQELPDVQPQYLTYIKATADEALALAQAEERDNSPIYFAPNISPYTR
jgi:hypothetical protein